MTRVNNFISLVDHDEEDIMYSKSDNTEIMMNSEADVVIKELFDSLKNRYQINLESMKGSELAFNFVYLLYHRYHIVNENWDGSYKDSPD